jgi:error-prone DNA polymerase
LCQEHGEQIERGRKNRRFESLDDFKRRIFLTKHELRILAELGALNCFVDHRRAAMWRVEETLYDDLLESARAPRDAHFFGKDVEKGGRDASLPLTPMTLPERVKADYETMNLTTGPHPMNLLREKLPNIWRAIDLVQAQHGSTVQIAGNVICRQRPGTAKGFVFISLEDETGVSNAIVDPNLFERFRLVITEEAFLLIEGEVQNSDGVVLIKARNITPLVHLPVLQSGETLVGSESHDFR